MSNFTTNPVAGAYVAATTGGYAAHKGALMLVGYLEVPQPAVELAEGAKPTPEQLVLLNAQRARLYIEDSFRIYYEFARRDLLHQIPGGAEPAQPMDVVWIRREAPMQRVEHDYAFVLAETDFDYSMGGPRPPHSGPRPPHSGPRPPHSGPRPPFN